MRALENGTSGETREATGLRRICRKTAADANKSMCKSSEPHQKGTCAVGEYANQACVPEMRAHNLGNTSCSKLMVIGESVSFDCSLNELQQYLSVHLKPGNIFLLLLFFS